MKHGMKVLLRGSRKIIDVKRTYEINNILGTVIFTLMDGEKLHVAHDCYEIVEKW